MPAIPVLWKATAGGSQILVQSRQPGGTQPQNKYFKRSGARSGGTYTCNPSKHSGKS